MPAIDGSAVGLPGTIWVLAVAAMNAMSPIPKRSRRPESARALMSE